MSSSKAPVGLTAVASRLVGRYELGASGLLIVNVAFLFVFFIYDFNLYQLLLAYWWECLWIGIFCAIKLIAASLFGDPYENRFAHFSRSANVVVSIAAIALVSAEFLTLFAVLGLFVVVLPSQFSGLEPSDMFMDGLGAVVLSSLLFLAGHTLSFFSNFIAGREYESARAVPLLLLPFNRCIALVGAIVFSYAVAFLAPGLATSGAFAALVILMKMAWDYRLHTWERTVLARFACSGGARVKRDVFASGGNCRANRPAVYAGRSYADKKLAIETGVSGQPRPFADFLSKHRLMSRHQASV